MREIFGQKVAQPHPTKVSLSPPRAVGVSVETGDCNDTGRDRISSQQYYVRGDPNLLCSNGMSRRRYIQLSEAKEMAVKRDVCTLHLHLPLP